MMAYPTYKGVSSYQAWLRTNDPAKGTYSSFMTPGTGGASPWQNYMRTGKAYGTTTPSAPANPAAQQTAAPVNYVQDAENELAPAFNRIYGNVKSAYNERGMLGSSAYGQAMQDVGTTQAQTLANAVRARRESGQNFAAKLYELLYSGALGRGTLAQSNEGIDYPTTPQWMLNLVSNYGLEPKAGAGPTGDAGETEGSRPGTSRYNFKFYQREQDEIANRQNAARLALAQRAQSFSERQYADSQKAESDPLRGIAEKVAAWDEGGRMTGNSRLISLLNSYYDTDIAKQAASDPRYLEIYKVIYPKSWRQRLGLEVAEAEDNAVAGMGAPTAYEGLPVPSIETKMKNTKTGYPFKSHPQGFKKPTWSTGSGITDWLQDVFAGGRY